MKSDVVSAVMRLFKALIAADLREYSISNTIADIAIKTWGTDVAKINNTFHKSFSTVENTDYRTLIYQQLLNYYTTYGAEFFGCYESNFVFIPVENSEIPEFIRGLKLVVIRPYTPEQIRDKIIALAKQNAGLSDKVLDDLMTLFTCYFPDITSEEIANLPNRELKIRLYEVLSIIPVRPDEFLRYIIYKSTGKTLLIKNRYVIDILNKWAASDDGFDYIYKAIKIFNPCEIASSYHRYHEYWLSLKQKNPTTDEAKVVNAFINKVSKLADKHHKPLPLNVMQNICDTKITLGDIEKAVKSASDAQLLKTWAYLDFVLSASSQTTLPRNYNIRNNTVWTKEGTPKPTDTLYQKIKPVVAELRKRYGHLANKKFYIPENILYPIYTSGKKASGIIPLGTVMRLPVHKKQAEKSEQSFIDKVFGYHEPEANIIVAIHWFDVSDRVDLDLHALMDNCAVGWNTRYKTDRCEIIYSGDMTAAPKPTGATEAILVKYKAENIEISFTVNTFTMNKETVPFDIIIARGSEKDVQKNCVIDPNKIIIKFSTEMTPGKAQQEIGTLIKNDEVFTFVVGGYNTGNKRVCSIGEIQNIRRQAAKLEFHCYPKFTDFLKEVVCFYEIVQTSDEADYDLSPENLMIDTFSSIMFPNNDKTP